MMVATDVRDGGGRTGANMRKMPKLRLYRPRWAPTTSSQHQARELAGTIVMIADLEDCGGRTGKKYVRG